MASTIRRVCFKEEGTVRRLSLWEVGESCFLEWHRELDLHLEESRLRQLRRKSSEWRTDNWEPSTAVKSTMVLTPRPSSPRIPHSQLLTIPVEQMPGHLCLMWLTFPGNLLLGVPHQFDQEFSRNTVMSEVLTQPSLFPFLFSKVSYLIFLHPYVPALWSLTGIFPQWGIRKKKVICFSKPPNGVTHRSEIKWEQHISFPLLSRKVND